MNRLTPSIHYNRTALMWSLGAILLWVHLAATCSCATPDFLRAEDEVWIVSTRHLGYPKQSPPDLRVQYLDRQAGWQRSDVSSLIGQAFDERMWVIFVHGNRLEYDEVTTSVWDMYRCLTMGRADAPPLRFVAWSWPSDKRRGILSDVRAKASRTESDGYYLGWFLSQLPEDRPLRLVGYSFGARVVTGASHLLGGGKLSGRSLPNVVMAEQDQPVASRPRVVLMAAATHSHWLRPGCYHERALHRIGSLLNIYNGSDRILKRYRAIDNRFQPEALGYSGMYTADLSGAAERIEQLNAARMVGRQHRLANYQRNGWLRSRIQSFIYGDPTPADPAGDDDHDQADSAVAAP